MEQSQLFELIRTLKPLEKEQLLHFSANLHFNNGRHKAQIIPLFEIFLNHLRDDVSQKLEKKTVYSALFPTQAFVEGKVEKVMVEAHKVLRTFLLVQYYFREENEFYQTLDFSEIVRRRGLADRYQNLMSRLRKSQEEVVRRDIEYYFRQIFLEHAVCHVEALNNQRKGDLNIPNFLQSIELYAHNRRIELLNSYLLQQKVAPLIVPEVIQSNLEDSVVPQRYLDKSRLLQINYTIFNILKKGYPSLSDIHLLFDLLQKHEKELSWQDIQELSTHLRNFCIMILMPDPENEEIMQLRHNIYKDNLERGYLHYEGEIGPGKYRAVFESALNIKEYEWANEFIERYKNEIRGENDTRDIYRYNKADYLFAIGQYEACLDLIPDTSPFNEYLLMGKRMEIKALYELRSELLPYKLDAFKMFLSRTSPKLLSEVLRRKNQDFVNLLVRIADSLPGDVPRAEKIIKRIQEKKETLEWYWLLEKAKELKERKH